MVRKGIMNRLQKILIVSNLIFIVIVLYLAANPGKDNAENQELFPVVSEIGRAHV